MKLWSGFFPAHILQRYSLQIYEYNNVFDIYYKYAMGKRVEREYIWKKFGYQLLTVIGTHKNSSFFISSVRLDIFLETHNKAQCVQFVTPAPTAHDLTHLLLFPIGMWHILAWLNDIYSTQILSFLVLLHIPFFLLVNPLPDKYLSFLFAYLFKGSLLLVQ